MFDSKKIISKQSECVYIEEFKYQSEVNTFISLKIYFEAKRTCLYLRFKYRSEAKKFNINPNSLWWVHMGISFKERQITEEPMKVKIWKIANPQALSVEYFVFSDFRLKMSLYFVLEAKNVRNWKSEIHWWAHYLVRNKKIVKFCVYRSLDMKSADTPQWFACRQIEASCGFLHLSTNKSGLPVLARLGRRPIGAGQIFS